MCTDTAANESRVPVIRYLNLVQFRETDGNTMLNGFQGGGCPMTSVDCEKGHPTPIGESYLEE